MATIQEAKTLNKDKGFFFFEPDTMRFFNSKIESEIMKDQYFITSERFERTKDYPKKFTIRQIDWESGNIHTIGKFQQFDTLKQALKYLIESL